MTPKRIKYKGQIYEAKANHYDYTQYIFRKNKKIFDELIASGKQYIDDDFGFNEDDIRAIMNDVTLKLIEAYTDERYTEAVEDAKLDESNGMRKYTRGELRDMIRTGMAKELTSYDDIPKDYDKIGYSSGVYGINGGLIQDRETGEFYAILDRGSLLLRIF